MATSSFSVTVLSNAAATLNALKRLVDWSDEVQLAYAWLSSANGKADHWQALELRKITRAVIGIHFAQTEPHALKQLAKLPQVLKVINDTTGVFHPKVAVGVQGVEAQAILGSSNLTTGGFGGNTELNALISGPVDRAPISTLIEFIDNQWTSARAFVPDRDWFVSYEDTYRRRPSPPRPPKPKTGRRILVKTIKDLNVPWHKYYTLISEQERRTLASGNKIHVFDHEDGSYLQEVDLCREVFEKYSSFSAMPEKERKLVAGFGGGSYGWFGWMGGAGYFKQLVKTKPDLLAKRLDQIPFDGPVLGPQARAYLESMLRLKGVGMGAATRLLAVKRPDLFFPINEGNKPLMRQILGWTTANVSKYLGLHEIIWALPWFNSQMPDGVHERRVWNARVALLDALLYEIPPDR